MDGVIEAIVKVVLWVAKVLIAYYIFWTVCYFIGWSACKLVTMGKYPQEHRYRWSGEADYEETTIAFLGVGLVVMLSIYLTGSYP
jgi:hypothetical protein